MSTPRKPDQCQHCAGRGGSYNPSTHETDQCGSCRGSGKAATITNIAADLRDGTFRGANERLAQEINMSSIRYYLRNPEWSLTRASEGASGYDVRADSSVLGDISTLTLAPGQRMRIPTGLFLAMPLGVEAQARSRSGLALDHGVVVIQGIGTIDSDYRGEVTISLANTDWRAPHEIKHGDRIAQIVFCPVLIGFVAQGFGSSAGGFHPRTMELTRVASIEALGTTARGAGGHGSTGR